MKFKKRFKGISAGILLSVALSFLLSFYAPIELFVGSQSDFWFGLEPILLVSAMLFGICTGIGIVLFVLLRLIGKWPYRIVLAIGFTVLIVCYIQGNFLVSDLPPLDGTAVDWGAYPAQRFTSIGLLVGIFLILIFLMIKFKKLFQNIVSWGSAGLTAMLAITLTTLVLSTPITDKEGFLKPTDHNDLQYSTQQNLIVLVTDAVDSNEFLDALNANPEFSDTFDDFTYFDDALAGYPFTRNALPLLLTGEWYENNSTFEQYLSSAFTASPLMQKLREEDYKIGLYNTGELTFDAATYDGVFENQINVTPSFESNTAAFTLVAKMTAIRYAPWDLKDFGYDAVAYADSIRRLPDDKYGDVKKKNTVFYSALKDKNAITLTENKCARILHIEGAHVPFIYDKEVNVIENGTYRDNLEATLTICDTFLTRLKESGVYDNSVIVILGDHGFNNTGNTGMGYRMHPTLMIKGIGETGEQMKMDSTPISYEQLSRAFVSLLNKTPTADVFPENTYPDGRRFIGYWYSHEDAMEEYLVTGKADEVDKLQTTGKQYHLK